MNLHQFMVKLGIDVQDRARRGRLWGKCPFHNDVNASWFIRTEGERAGQHHCFSCKSGGTLTLLVAHVMRVDYFRAAKIIKQCWDSNESPFAESNQGLTISRVYGVSMVRNDSLDTVDMKFGRLWEWPSIARTYVESRFVTVSQVDRWGIGYAIDGRLSGRIIIPVWFGSRLRSYQARTFVNDKRRYLYPDSSERPDLDLMFGEAYWPALSDRKSSRVVVCEGAFNALAVERAVGGYIAALGGSDIRSMHVAKLSTFGAVDIFTDCDAAGEKAAERLIWSLKNSQAKLRRITLTCKDIDETDPKMIKSYIGLLFSRIGL